jgi:hypothetical protein
MLQKINEAKGTDVAKGNVPNASLEKRWKIVYNNKNK